MNNDNLYVIRSFGKNGKTIVKLGYSNNIKDRIELYKSHNPFIEVIFTYYRSDAKLLEATFHKVNKPVFKNEWYAECKLNYIINVINNFTIDDLQLNNSNQVKTCTKCNKVKTLNRFNKNKRGKFNVTSVCKNCRAKYRKYSNEYNAEYQRKYREANKESIKEYQRKYRLKNK